MRNLRDTVYAARRLWRVGAADPGVVTTGYGFHRAIPGHHNPTRARAVAMVSSIDPNLIRLFDHVPADFVPSVPRQLYLHATHPQYEVVGRDRIPVPLSKERKRYAARQVSADLFHRRSHRMPLYPANNDRIC